MVGWFKDVLIPPRGVRGGMWGRLGNYKKFVLMMMMTMHMYIIIWDWSLHWNECFVHKLNFTMSGTSFPRGFYNGYVRGLETWCVVVARLQTNIDIDFNSASFPRCVTRFDETWLSHVFADRSVGSINSSMARDTVRCCCTSTDQP